MLYPFKRDPRVIEAKEFVDNLSDAEVNATYALVGVANHKTNVDSKRNAIFLMRLNRLDVHGNQGIKVPEKDPAFEALCNNYKEETKK